MNQVQSDIIEIVLAAEAGGRKLANRTYTAIVQARKLSVVQSKLV